MGYRIGCSGWSYPHWRERLYPKELAASRWLPYYAGQFDTVELNNTFYRLPTERAVKSWHDDAPDGFVFAVKASRYLTHFLRLKNAAAAFERFEARARGLGERLGPILHQLPDNFPRDDARLRHFLALLPRDLLHVFEFRDRSWWHDGVYAILRDHGAAFCMYDRGDEKTPVVATCAEAYLRMHGPAGAYAGRYADAQLRRWAQKLGALEGVRRAWVYFNNDAGAQAPRDGLRLRRMLRAAPYAVPPRHRVVDAQGRRAGAPPAPAREKWRTPPPCRRRRPLPWHWPIFHRGLPPKYRRR